MSFKLKRRDSVEPTEANLQESAETVEKKPQKAYSVTLYICILFAFVIVLVLLSYFGQRRDNSRALLSLREQHDQVTSQAFDNIEKLQEKNMELLNENNEQKKTIDKLQARITELENDAEKTAEDTAKERDAMKKEIQAAEDIFALRAAIAAKDAEKAAQLIEKLNGETEELPQNGKEMLNELKAEYDALINPQEEEKNA